IAPGAPELASFRLSGVGRAESLAAPSPGEVSHQGARVEIRRGEVTEWYRNAPTGLEQGFTLAGRPDGNGALVLELAIGDAEGALAGDSLILQAPGGRSLMYGSLHASDSEGHFLPAHFELASTDLARLVVDDARATYPVTIDPILTNPFADTSIDDGDNDSFGFSVASAGDTDGDGYADVIIGAPDFDDTGMGAAGAALIFRGDPNGMGATNTATAWTLLRGGAADVRLGEKVASAGDVNGDGYGDVIVSASGEALIFLGGPNGIRDGTPAFADTVLSQL